MLRYLAFLLFVAPFLAAWAHASLPGLLAPAFSYFVDDLTGFQRAAMMCSVILLLGGWAICARLRKFGGS